jgi:RNA polymerase sigma factor FliA
MIAQEEHLRLVRTIATLIRNKLPIHVELSDLLDAGIAGLFGATLKFNENHAHGASFDTYARHRIRGAILDDLRHQDWATRNLRKRWKQVEAVQTALADELARPPTDVEIAKAIGFSLKRWAKLQADFRLLVLLLSTHTRAGTDAEPLEARSPEMGPEEAAERRELCEILAAAAARLPPRWKTLIELYYQHDVPMKQIGELLGINESRVSQIHKQALLRMRITVQKKGINGWMR